MIKNRNFKKYAELGYPNSWYFLGLSKEFPVGKMKTITFMGSEVIVFRTSNGKINVSDPYCPHLGAHFGHGGKIVKDHLYCPFHGFEFNDTGKCVKTGYGTKPPPSAKLYMWPVNEVNGFVMIYYHRNKEEPVWKIPELSNQEEWGSVFFKTFILNEHPQSVTENSVDVGHFKVLHKFEHFKELDKTRTDGPYLTTSYGFRKAFFKPFGALLKEGIKVNIRAHVHGMGYSFVDLKVLTLKYRIRFWVFPTPIDEEKVALRFALCRRKSKGILRLFDNISARITLRNSVKEAFADFPIWENKVYVEKPAFAKGDGALSVYSKWAKQFYRDEMGNEIVNGYVDLETIENNQHIKGLS